MVLWSEMGSFQEINEKGLHLVYESQVNNSWQTKPAAINDIKYTTEQGIGSVSEQQIRRQAHRSADQLSSSSPRIEPVEPTTKSTSQIKNGTKSSPTKLNTNEVKKTPSGLIVVTIGVETVPVRTKSQAHDDSEGKECNQCVICPETRKNSFQVQTVSRDKLDVMNTHKEKSLEIKDHEVSPMQLSLNCDLKKCATLTQDTLAKLKESTKRLTYLLDDIQSKTSRTSSECVKRDSSITVTTREIRKRTEPQYFSIASQSTTDATTDVAPALTRATITRIPVFDPMPACHCSYANKNGKVQENKKEKSGNNENKEDTTCTVYRKLTRKCQCLNIQEYNDFIILFNEDTQYTSNASGEVIKNIKIIKKFLYMGSQNTKNALQFLNQGLRECRKAEQIEILQGCIYADICNIFEGCSIIGMCVSCLCKIEEDVSIQKLAAELLYRIAQFDEGNRYLTFNSKITNEIKKFLKSMPENLGMDTKELLYATTNLLDRSQADMYAHMVDEGMVEVTLSLLAHNHMTMKPDDLLLNLELLQNLCSVEKGQEQLCADFTRVSNLIKDLLENNKNKSEVNIIVTSILNNILLSNACAKIATSNGVKKDETAAEEPRCLKRCVDKAKNPEESRVVHDGADSESQKRISFQGEKSNCQLFFEQGNEKPEGPPLAIPKPGKNINSSLSRNHNVAPIPRQKKYLPNQTGNLKEGPRVNPSLSTYARKAVVEEYLQKCVVMDPIRGTKK